MFMKTPPHVRCSIYLVTCYYSIPKEYLLPCMLISVLLILILEEDMWLHREAEYVFLHVHAIPKSSLLCPKRRPVSVTNRISSCLIVKIYSPNCRLLGYTDRDDSFFVAYNNENIYQLRVAFILLKLWSNRGSLRMSVKQGMHEVPSYRRPYFLVARLLY